MSSIFSPKKAISWCRARSVFKSDRGQRTAVETLERRLLLSAGALDATYGVSGKVIWDPAAFMRAAVLQGDDKLVVAGPSTDGNSPKFAVSRLTASGSLDQGFGTGGLATITLPTPNSEWKIDYAGAASQADGRILVGGRDIQHHTNPNFDTSPFAVARLNNDGSLDSTFGSGGFVLTDFANTVDAQLIALAVQADGKIVASGWGYVAGRIHFLVVRYNSDGSTDTSFAGGQLNFVAGLSAAYLQTMAIQPDGKIVAIGGGSQSDKRDTVIVRLNTDGTLDNSFGSGGISELAYQGSFGNLIVSPEGSIFADSSQVLKFTSIGTLDTTFGIGGIANTFGRASNTSMALETDGKLLLGETISDPDGLNSHLTVVRLNPDGMPDWTFAVPTGEIIGGGSGAGPQNVFIQSDKKIVALMRSHASTQFPTFTAARLDSGSLATGAAAAFSVSGYSPYISPGISSTVTVAAEDKFGRPATAFTGTIHFTSSDSQAVLPQDYNFTAADHGTHTFGATFQTPGTQVIYVLGAVAAAGSQSDILVHSVPSYILPFTSSHGGQLHYQQGGISDISRNRLYYPTIDGRLQIYDINTGTLLTPLDLNPAGSVAHPGEGDITIDGNYLYIPDTISVNGIAVIYKVNLSNNSIVKIALPLGANTTAPFTLKIAANGKAFLPTNGPNGIKLFQLDTANDTVSQRSDLPFPASQENIYSMLRGADRRLLVFKQEAISNGSAFTYDAATDTFPHSFKSGTYNMGEWAINRDGTRIAYPVYGNKLQVVDQNFNPVTTLSGFNGWMIPFFDPIRDVLYTAVDGQQTITAYDSTTWTTKTSFAAGEAASIQDSFLFAADDGRTLYLAGPADTRVYNISDMPTSLAGGPYTVAEGGHIIFDSSGSYSVQHPIASIEWDSNYDGLTFHSSATGSTFSAVGVNGLSTRVVALRVTDSAGHSAISTTTLTVTDVAPTLKTSGALNVFAGTGYTLTLSATDPGPDPILSWTIDWGDSTSPQTINGNPTSLTYTYATGSGTGPFKIISKATNQDATFTAPTTSVNVFDPPVLTGGTLNLYGGNNSALFLSSDSSSITATIASLTRTFANSTVSKLNVVGNAGNDAVVIGSNLPPISLNLGNGNNFVSITANDKNDGPITIVCGSGNDGLSVNPLAAENITFDGGGGRNTITVSESQGGNTAPETQSISSTLLAVSSAGQNLSISFANIELLQVSGADGSDVFNINVATSMELQIHGAAGNDTFNIMSASGLTTITGDSENDTLNLLSPSSANISFDGGNGNNAAFLQGASAADSYFISPGTIADLNTFVSFANLQSLAIHAGVGDDTLTIYRQLPCATTFDGGLGSNSLVVSGQISIDGTTISYPPIPPLLSFANVDEITYLYDNVTDGLLDNGPTPVEIVVGALPNSGTPPVANAGGPYSILEGGQIQLDGSGSTTINGSILSYRWSVIDSKQAIAFARTGQKPVLSLPSVDGPNVLAVTLYVTDSAGNTSSATTSITVADVSPTATFAGGGSVSSGSSGSVSFTGAIDPSPADNAAGFLYSYDFDNDGKFEVVNSMSAVATVSGNYLSTGGLHTIHGRIADKDGGYTDYSTTISVPPNASVTGRSFGDTNANGVLDAGEIPTAAVGIYLDANGNGILDPGEYATTSDSSGIYVFSNIVPGAYTIRPQLPNGWIETDGIPGISIMLTPGAMFTGKDIGIMSVPLPDVAGPYSVAEGGNVLLDAGTSSEVGGTIIRYEWDTNYSGTTFTTRASGVSTSFSAAGLDGPGTRAIALRVTDANGATAIATTTVMIKNAPPIASFANGGPVTLGSTGSVSFTNPTDPSPADVAAGFKYSYDFDNDGTFEITDSTSTTATVPAANLSTAGSHTIHGRIKDKDGGFTDYTTIVQVNPAPASASIAGTAFNDANGNGKRDTGETAQATHKFYIDKNLNGVLDAGETTITSGGSGTYNFTGLAAGTYRIRDVLPTGWRRTNPPAGYYDVTVSAGQVVTGEDFAETSKGLIAGVVFKDTNSNGTQDTGESALSGWVVYLDTNNNGKLDAGELSFTTGADGKYSFVVAAGKYNVREVLKTGFTRTTPSSGVYAITLTSGLSVTGKNFGDR